MYTCGAADRPHLETLDATFSQLATSGVDVVRFWAFQSYATDEAGARNWTALDRVFSVAQAHHIALIPVLGNNWKDCDYWPASAYASGAGQRKDSTDWYRDAFRQPYDGYRVSYLDWVAEVGTRFGGHPSLVGWELVNEPRARSHAYEDVAALHAFLVTTRDALAAVDPGTPVSFGAIGSGEPGFAGLRYRQLAREADLATAHDYDHPDEPLPGERCEFDCVRSALRDAIAEARPFYVGESGIASCDTEARADQLMRKMAAAFEAGADGYVFWAYDQRAQPDDCGFDFGPRSPLLAAIARFRGRPLP